MKRTLALIASLVLAACGNPELHVESNTSWEGVVGTRQVSFSIDGTGNRVFDIEGDACWSVQKLTREGFLRVFAVQSTPFGRQRTARASTSAEFGIVSGCMNARDDYYY